ncbi:single-stranded DNA-binding protein [Candidatus Pacearchaeota archaeon]|nr:single-stranded DNA-binding protein [Candidatus Pacearchaeota archaeon]
MSLNKVMLIGRLGADPEVRYLDHGDAVATFSIATSEKWTDKNSGKKEERTEWHRCVAWRRLGEVCGEYLSKGKQVYVEGKLQTREWTDRDGVKRSTTEVVLSNMVMLGSAGNRPQGPGEADAPPHSKGTSAPDEDDIPF